jgi:uncharacterized membrane protein
VTWPEGYRVTEADPEPAERRDDAVVWTGPTEFGPGEPRLDVAPTRPVPVGSLAVGLAVVVVVAAATVAGLYVRNSMRGSEHQTRQDRTGTADGGTRTEREPTPEPKEPPPELLSNEERVVRTLRAAGGRMRQQALVAELGWTEARTSQVLRGLREDGTVESFRLGRENVLTLGTGDEGVTDERP